MQQGRTRMPPPTPGQWVWAPAPPGAPAEQGRWLWMSFTPPAAAGRPNATGRIGLFVAGYFGLGLVLAAYELLLGLLGGGSASDPRVASDHLLAGIVAVGFAAALVAAAAKARRTSLEPLGIMAVFGAALYVAIAAGSAAATAGAGPTGVFWAVVLTTLPFATAVLLWQPHPILGVNVALAATAFVVGVPLGDGGAAGGAGKALLLAIVLASLAVLIDLRTRSRAGSVLHHSGTIVAAVAKILLAVELGGLEAVGVVGGLAVAELFLSLMLRRRFWAASGWITLALALVAAIGAAPAEAALGSIAGGIVAIPLGIAAFVLQAHGEDCRRTVLAALPPGLASSFPP